MPFTLRVSGPQYVHLHAAVDGQGGDEGLVGGAAVEHHPHHARHGELVDVGPLREHQPAACLGLRVGEHRLHCAGLHHAAALQDGHVGADLLHHRHLVGNDHGGDAHAPVDVLDQPEDAAGGGGVQGGGGLVAQQHLGIGGQGAGDGDALLLAAGELGRVGVGLVGQAHDVQILQGALPRLPLGHPGDLHGEADVAQAGALHEQVELLEDHADGAALLPQLGGGQLHEILSVDDHLARCRALQQVDAAHQGGLARAAHAHDAEDVPVPDGQIDVVQGLKHAVGRGKGLGNVF